MKTFKASPSNKLAKSTTGGAGVMSVINPAKNTKRLTFRKDFLLRIGYEEGDTIQIMHGENYICIAVYPIFGREITAFAITGFPKCPSLYNAALVKEITDVFDLDFSERVSITFNDVIFKKRKKSGKPYAKVMIRSKKTNAEEVQCDE